jgi:hypothetical protein
MVLGNHHFEKNRKIVHCRCCEHLRGHAEERGGLQSLNWMMGKRVGNLNFHGKINKVFLYAVDFLYDPL